MAYSNMNAGSGFKQAVLGLIDDLSDHTDTSPTLKEGDEGSGPRFRAFFKRKSPTPVAKKL